MSPRIFGNSLWSQTFKFIKNLTFENLISVSPTKTSSCGKFSWSQTGGQVLVLELLCLCMDLTFLGCIFSPCILHSVLFFILLDIEINA